MRKILLKILVVPFALALSPLAALLGFLFDICAFLVTIASVILAVLDIALFFMSIPIGGIVFLFLAFLTSVNDKRALRICRGLGVRPPIDVHDRLRAVSRPAPAPIRCAAEISRMTHKM